MDPPEQIRVAPPAKEAEHRRSLQSFVFTALALGSMWILFIVLSESHALSSVSNSADTVDFRKGGNDKLRNDKLRNEKVGNSKAENGKAENACSGICLQRRSNSANLLDFDDMIGRVESARSKLLDKLRTDYGEFFEPIFLNEETGKWRPVVPMTEGGVSLERLKRKLAVKILSMQSKVGAVDSDFRGCDCSAGGNDRVIRADEVLASLDPADDLAAADDDDEDNGLYEKYVWATGGHSASAGHGNLYNETYTSYMETDLKDIFGAVGIEFEGRNYAMGNTDAATGVSMCWKEIFGEDVDFFSWDYGMVDGNYVAKLLHYAYRGALSPNRPGLLMLHYNGRAGAKRLQAIRDLEAMGMTTFIADEDAQKAMKDAFPDSAGINGADIESLPDYVRNYRCGEQIEKGDPYCNRDKYTKWGCSPRWKQTSWHPGYKDHARVGHGLALFWVETLLDTLKELSENDEAADTSGLLSRLVQEDIDLHSNFTLTKLPDLHRNLLKLPEIEANDGGDVINSELFFRGPSMCHTAKLPSDSRYRGILTATNQVGQPAPYGEETYYVGHDIEVAKKTATEDSEIRLVYSTNRERDAKCAGVLIKPDYPDSWYANTMDEWTKLVFPNDAEQEHYGYDSTEYQGIILLNWKKCDWGKCPTHFLTPEDLAKNDWEMKVNSQRVSELIDVNHGSWMVKGEDTGFIFEPDANGKYTIELKVNKISGFVEITAFVLY